MLPGFTDLPVEIVVATTREALQSQEFSRTLGPLSNRIEYVTCCTPPPSRHPLANARHRLRGLIRAIRTLDPDHVMVCYADGIWDQAALATLVGRRPWSHELPVEGWIFRGRFGDRSDQRWKSVVRRWLFKRLLRQGLFRRLHLHHELLYEFAKPPSVATSTDVVLAPDPIEIRPPMTHEEARRELGVQGTGRWIGVAGAIAQFKGAHLFLDAYRIRRERGGEPLLALLAGPHDEKTRQLLAQSPYREWVEEGSVVSVDRFLDEKEMYAAAAAVDVMVTPYPRHQNRSSIILWAAAAGRPSLGTNSSCIAHVIRHERLGMTSDVLDTSALATAIDASLAMPWSDEDAQRVRRYAEFHRIENYQQISSQLVRERLAQLATAELAERGG
jgi:glycosyltransferase involved in cell wall biosynthesis